MGVNPLRIAITGWAGSGKTEAAMYLREKYGGDIRSFAFPIKYIDNYVFGSTLKNRDRLQRIGEFFREFDPNIWINHLIETVDLYEEKNIFVDDLRRENEYIALLKEGFKVIRIVADEDVRVQRLIDRDGQCDISLLYNESEAGISHLSLHEIENNGSLEDFYQKIDTYLENEIWSKE